MDDFDIDIRSLLGMLRRQLRLIVVTLLAVVGVTALVTFSLTPVFTASTLVLVDTSQKNLLAPDYAIGMVGMDDARVESEIVIIKSDSTLMRVVKELNLVADPEFGPKLSVMDRLLSFLQIAKPTLPTGEEALNGVLSRLDAALSADRRSVTNLIDLKASTESPERSAAIANAWAKTYIADQVSGKIDSTLASRDVLQSRLENARKSVVEYEGAMDKFIDDNLGQIVDDTGRTDIADLRQRLEDSSARRAREAARADVAQSSLRQRDWSQLAETLQSDALTELERQRVALNTAVSLAPAERAVALRDDLARIEQLLLDAAGTEVTTLRQNVNLEQAREGELRQQLRDTVLASSLSPEILTNLYGLQQTAEVARQQYQTLLARIQDFGAQADLQIADSRIVSPALPPSGKSFPNTSLSLILAAIIGAALGVVLAFLREHLVGGLLTEDQTESVLRVPVATAIPRQRRSETDDPGDNIADLLVTAPLSTFAESVRRIRVAIEQATGRGRLTEEAHEAEGITVLVTSSTSNEGKSTIALALARAMAVSKKSVLLIDCDLRRPSIQKMAGISHSNTMVETLIEDRGSGDFSAMIHKDSISPVGIIANADPSTVPTDQLIASDTFSMLLRAARRSFDIVVIDTPPVGPVVDALYLAPAADVILYVVRSSSTSQTEARLSLGTVLKAKGERTQVLAVLNQQERASASYKSRYEAYYYSKPA